MRIALIFMEKSQSVLCSAIGGEGGISDMYIYIQIWIITVFAKHLHNKQSMHEANRINIVLKLKNTKIPALNSTLNRKGPRFVPNWKVRYFVIYFFLIFILLLPIQSRVEFFLPYVFLWDLFPSAYKFIVRIVQDFQHQATSKKGTQEPIFTKKIL